jgi:hypothetical protein
MELAHRYRRRLKKVLFWRSKEQFISGPFVHSPSIFKFHVRVYTERDVN